MELQRVRTEHQLLLMVVQVVEEVETILQEDQGTHLLLILRKEMVVEQEFLQDLNMVQAVVEVQVVLALTALVLQEEVVELELQVQLTDHLLRELEVVEVVLIQVQVVELEVQAVVVINKIMVKQKLVAELGVALVQV